MIFRSVAPTEHAQAAHHQPHARERHCKCASHVGGCLTYLPMQPIIHCGKTKSEHYRRKDTMLNHFFDGFYLNLTSLYFKLVSLCCPFVYFFVNGHLYLPSSPRFFISFAYAVLTF